MGDQWGEGRFRGSFPILQKQTYRRKSPVLKSCHPLPPAPPKIAIKHNYPTCFSLVSPRLRLSLPLHFSLSASPSSACCPTLFPRCAALPRRPQGRGGAGLCAQLSDAVVAARVEAAVQCGSTWLQSRCSGRGGASSGEEPHFFRAAACSGRWGGCWVWWSPAGQWTTDANPRLMIEHFNISYPDWNLLCFGRSFQNSLIMSF